jgi:hypothetical protein
MQADAVLDRQFGQQPPVDRNLFENLDGRFQSFGQ